MKKFPVVSRNGIEYLVKINRHGGGAEGKVYQYKIIPLVNIKFLKRVDNPFGWGIYFNEKEWDFNYIGMARRCVEVYESKISESIRNSKKQKEQQKLFENWDGKL